MILPDSQKPPDAEKALKFLRLLEDVGAIQQDLLEETERLRARVEELETGRATVPAPAPAQEEGGTP